MNIYYVVDMCENYVAGPFSSKEVGQQYITDIDFSPLTGVEPEALFVVKSKVEVEND